MTENLVKVPTREPVAFEKQISIMRRIAILFRIIGLLGALGVFGLIVSTPTTGHSSNILITALILGFLFGVGVYSFGVGFDFLADLGQIVLSLKRDTQDLRRKVIAIRGEEETRGRYKFPENP